MIRKDIAASHKQIETLILVVRGQRVMLDADLAVLYGVSTRRLNEQVKRNPERFPADFMFRLTRDEFDCLMSQNATSRSGWGGRRKLPLVFTEHGVAMLSSVVRSRTASRVNVEIMRAFVRLRRLLATPGELAQQLTRLAESVELHDDQIKAITDVLRQMMAAPAAPEIGFHTIRPTRK
jgi:ORF6N domain